MCSRVSGPEQLPVKSLMPLWLNGFSRERRRLVKGARQRLSPVALNALCHELKPACKECGVRS